MQIPDWKLPRGVSRSLWEFAQDRELVEREEEHLAGTALLELDRRLVERWFPDPGNLIDLGCGTGRLLATFASRGFRVLGVDLSGEALQAARGRTAAAGTVAGLLRANLCELDCVPAETFDFALLMFGTLGMVDGDQNRRAVLQQTRRVLRPGGRLALHVHSVWRHLAVRRGRVWLFKDRLKRLLGSHTAGDTYRDYRGIPGMYHHVFTRREVLALLRQTGFRVCEIVPVPPQYDEAANGVLDRFLVSGWMILAES